MALWHRGRRVCGLFGFVTVVLAGLVLGTAAARVTANEWTGTWKDTGEPNGVMTLTQSGNRVTGSWLPTNITSPYTVKGTVRGKEFIGTYSYPAGDPPVLQGPFSLRLTMSADLRSISGIQGGASPDFKQQRHFERSTEASFAMPARFGLRDGRGMVMYSAAKPNPPKWPVDLTLPGCDQSKLGAYRWQVDGKPAPAAKVVGGKQCVVEVDVRTLGRHHVKGTTATNDKAYDVDVLARDFLIVGLGDSVASGEGNPDVAAGAGGPLWQDARCDRSARSFEAQAALAIEQHDEQTSVSFVHLACSGAAIKTGITGPYWGIAPGDASLPLYSQMSHLKQLIGKRQVDAVMISIGANDVGFGPVLEFCVKHQDCPSTTYEGGKTLEQVIEERLARLPDLYAELAGRLAQLVPANRVYINLYPDELRDASGTFCDDMIDWHGVRAIRADEATWMYDGFMTPLNATIVKAAAAHGWKVISGAPEAFRNHGYCAGDKGWVVTYDQSFAGQKDQNGTMHPNETGHRLMGNLAAGLLVGDLYPAGKPRP